MLEQAQKSVLRLLNIQLQLADDLHIQLCTAQIEMNSALIYTTVTGCAHKTLHNAFLKEKMASEVYIEAVNNALNTQNALKEIEIAKKQVQRAKGIMNKMALVIG